MAKDTSVEKGSDSLEALEAQSTLVVRQPDKLEGLLDTISLLESVSERVGEDRSGDMGSAGTGGAQQDDSSTAQSDRAKAIANLAPEPELRKQLVEHIEKEVKVLRKEVRKKARRMSKPGSAYQLNEMYAQIRRLNTLLSHLLEASFDVVKRLFIRVFIDKQSIL